jgi:hypothetical protein
VRESDFPQLVPTDYRADLVIELVDPRDRPVLGAVLEVQLRRRQEKKWVWPVYAAALHAELRCTTVLLVITPSETVARWARRPIETFNPSSPFVPLVIGPEHIPLIHDPASAARLPELSVLSALAHGTGPKARCGGGARP